MANGYFERGEIYWVRLDSGFGYEQGVGRPGLIVSCDSQNRSSPTVTICFCSKQKADAWCVETDATGCTSYVHLSQLQTVDKNRLGKCIGVLNGAEQKDVDDLLEDFFDLGYADDKAVKEKDVEIQALNRQILELKQEIAKLEAQNTAHEDVVLGKDVEIAVHKRMYEKAVGIIAAMRAEPDLPERPMPPVKPPKKDPPKPTPEPKLADINTASFSVLRGVGLSNGIVLAVINGRPHKSVEDLKNVPGMNKKLFDLIEKRVCCVPVEAEEPVVTEVEKPSEKVNVNTASAVEIHEKTGLAMCACYAITGKRNREGQFKSLDDLVIPKRLSEATLSKYRDKMEV